MGSASGRLNSILRAYRTLDSNHRIFGRPRAFRAESSTKHADHKPLRGRSVACACELTAHAMHDVVRRARRQLVHRAFNPHSRATERRAQRARICALRAVSTRKARGRPKPFVLTDFGFNTRSVLNPSGANCAAGRAAPAGDAIRARYKDTLIPPSMMTICPVM